jgi:acetyl-CoA acetyltransferase
MPQALHDKTAIVGIGATQFFKRGRSQLGDEPRTLLDLAGEAVANAVDDAGLTVKDVDGLAYYCKGFDSALLAQSLGIPEVRYTAMMTGGGGGSAGSVGLAASAIVSGHADVVVAMFAVQQLGESRLGTGKSDLYAAPPSPEHDFIDHAGLVGPGQAFAPIVMRHMHLYGTTRDHFAEIVLSTRDNATRMPSAVMREPLTREQYFEARIIADPMCLYDFCLESDGAIAVVLTSTERAKDLRHDPIYLGGAVQGGTRRWGTAIGWMNMDDEMFASAGHRTMAPLLYERAGVGPEDIDVALIYDHFSPMVLMQLEDYGFCGIGEGGQFVADGNIRWPDGSLPLNPHGGNLSEVYMMGLTHVTEAVRQLRGTAVNQVEGAEVALVTGGPAPIPSSALVLHR